MQAGIPYWRLSGFYFLTFASIGCFLPFWSLYLADLGHNAKAIGILSTVIVVAKIFSTYLWGWVVDHTHKRIRVIRLTSLFAALSFIAVLFFESYWSLFILLFLFSMFWSAALPQIEAVTMNYLGEYKHSYTIVRVWGSVGFILIVIALGFWFEAQSIRTLPLIILLSLVLLWLVSLTLPNTDKPDTEIKKAKIKSVLLQPSVIALMLICFLLQASHGTYYTFYSIHLESYGYKNSFIGIAWAIGVIAEVIVFLFIHKCIKQIGLKKLMLFSLLIAAIRWVLIAYYIESMNVLILAQIMHAATFGIYHAVAIQYIHVYFQGNLQGRGQGLYSSVSFGAGSAFGALLSGYLWDWQGAGISFLTASVFAGIAFLIGIIALEEPEQDANLQHSVL